MAPCHSVHERVFGSVIEDLRRNGLEVDRFDEINSGRRDCVEFGRVNIFQRVMCSGYCRISVVNLDTQIFRTFSCMEKLCARQSRKTRPFKQGRICNRSPIRCAQGVSGRDSIQRRQSVGNRHKRTCCSDTSGEILVCKLHSLKLARSRFRE